jgi:tetratricopeptide (TPR) repeat protein
VAAALAAATLLCFSPVAVCGFVTWDDGLYVYENPHVLAGLTADGWRWAWTTHHAANWHPLTWLSLQFDAQLYGPRPRGYHLTNLFLHLANALLVFVLLRSATGAVWRSGLVAALFALHPLHVESVAWVAERKDVLSTLFGLLAILAYTRYVKAPSVARYVPVLLGMALGLLAKPTLVTLPCLLLLLDYWPLCRWRPWPVAAPQGAAAPRPVRLGRLLLEKVPLAALAVAGSAVTLWAQQRGGAVASFDRLPLSARLANALVSYLAYLRQMLLPVDLAAYYPHPAAGLGVGSAVACGLVLTTLTGLALAAGVRRRYVAVGWLWYLGTLVPVIGLVQVGNQARADRYTYLPLVGIFILLSWGLADLARRWRVERPAAVLAGAVLAYLMLTTWTQVHTWGDSEMMWEHALQVTGGNDTVYVSLGEVARHKGDLDTAVGCYRKALQFDPKSWGAHLNLGLALLQKGEIDAALRHLRSAARLGARGGLAHTNLGLALMQAGEWDAAIGHLQQAVRLAPEAAQAHNNLGLALRRRGNLEEAAAEFRESLRLQPELPAAHFNLGLLGLARKDWAAAADQFGRAVSLAPDNAKYRRYLALALHELGQTEEARAQYEQSLRLDRSWPKVARRQAWTLATDPDARRRDGASAVQEAEQIRQALGGSDPRVLDTLAAAYAEAGRYAEAVTTARAARAAAAGQPDLLAGIEERLRLFEKGQPFRAPP